MHISYWLCTGGGSDDLLGGSGKTSIRQGEGYHQALLHTRVGFVGNFKILL